MLQTIVMFRKLDIHVFETGIGEYEDGELCPKRGYATRLHVV